MKFIFLKKYWNPVGFIELLRDKHDIFLFTTFGREESKIVLLLPMMTVQESL
jgi:hypothetical protein